MSTNFKTFEEFISKMCASVIAKRHNITNNKVGDVTVNNMRILYADVYSPLQRHGIIFEITSGYRCYALNKKIGGRHNSAHLCGRAMDIQVFNMDEHYFLDHCEMYVTAQKVIWYPNIFGHGFFHIQITRGTPNSIKKYVYKDGKYLPYKD